MSLAIPLREVATLNKPKTTAKVLSSQTLYRGPVFGVRRDQVIEPGGVRTSRDVVTHSGSVVVLPVFPGQRFLLIRQYRHAVGQFLWELVAGRINPGESPLAAAKREMIEETGYRARRFRQLVRIYPTPGFVSEFMVVFAALGLTKGEARPESDERIVARQFSLPQLLTMIRSGKLRDAKSVAAILFYARFHGR